MASPTVSTISPSSGPLGGGVSVTITGANFTGTTGVTIGGTAATSVSVVDDSTLTCTTPAHSAGTASVLVANADGTNTANSLYTYQAAPTVASISPSSGPLGGGASVTITGTNFTGATGVTIGGTAATSVTVVSSTSITCTTPSHTAGTASVLVTTPSGTNAANSLYTYQGAPTVSGVSVSSGPITGGGSMTITGTNFTGATGVTIGGTAATSVSVVSGTSITCIIPAHSAGSASVLVTTPGGTNAANSLYTYMAAPTVTGISPSSGPLAGGTSVTLTGTNFTGATSVTIGGTAATGVTVVSSTSITCTTPAHSAGTASVLVTTPGGTSAAATYYTYVSAPTVSGISPTNGTANGGTTVTITGTNLATATGVTIGGSAATITSVSDTSIGCTTPPGSAGTASVLVTTPGGTNATNNFYTYVSTPPTVTAVSPTSGTSTGGTTVTITGTNFSAVSSVTFRGVAATDVTVVSSTTITCTSPAISSGTASVLVTTPSGTNAANSLFNYVPPLPTVSTVSPTTGSTLGGTTLTITGTNLSTTGGVTIGGVPATNVTVVSDTSITCITPAGSVGSADLVVTTTGGSSDATDQFAYELSVPSVTGISPVQGTTEGGTTVTITGSGFTGTTGVMIGGAAATRIVLLNDSTLTCTTPAGSAGAARSVVVTNPNGPGGQDGLFTYVLALPTVSKVSPPLGTAAGGTSVTLTGTHFTGATSVTFGGMAATDITVVNETTLTCTTPEGLAGTASVLVTATAGTSAANSLYYYVQAAPTDTYIYLKGGRGDGFVPLWTGTLSEEGMVSETGSALGTSGKEVSDPYRDIFPSTISKQTTSTFSAYLSTWVVPGPGSHENLYLDEGSTTASTGKGRLSDEVGHIKPRQFARVATWLIFTSQSGLSYKFRKDQVIGWGSQPRA